jgi:hypothetical protein
MVEVDRLITDVQVFAYPFVISQTAKHDHASSKVLQAKKKKVLTTISAVYMVFTKELINIELANRLSLSMKFF